MRKFGILSATIFLSILIAGIYGGLHDQITYTISQEYFTKFKYQQFGFKPEWFGGHRQTVFIIGFVATWWFGAWIGIIVGCTALIFKDHITMKKEIQNAIKIVFLTAIVFAISGFFYGKFYLTKTGVDWWLPADLIYKDKFIITGSIHNFSYMGGLAGLFIAEVLMLKKKIYNKAS